MRDKRIIVDLIFNSEQQSVDLLLRSIDYEMLQYELDLLQAALYRHRVKYKSRMEITQTEEPGDLIKLR